MLVAIDIESYDPGLHTVGDGSCKHGTDGSRILCVGTYDGQRAKAYIPGTGDWEEFKKMFEDKSIDKVYHNGMYDLSWLVCDQGLKIAGLQHDTMTRMTYIDEYAELGLDACCKHFHVKGKNKSQTIEAWWEEHKEDIITYLKAIGVPAKKNDDVWKHSNFLWDSFEEFRDKMIEYNLQDCVATWNLYQAQEAQMQKVYDAYMVDVKLIPHIINMKKTGVRIDKDAMKKLTGTIEQDLHSKVDTLYSMYGVDLEMIGSSKKLGARLNEMGIHAPIQTSTGNESWGADSMNRLMHYPVIPLIQEIKGYKKLLDTYMYGGMADAILDDGRIHCTFSPNKREDGGTVTGRFACSKPNLQQIPARNKAVGHSYGQDMRALFLPEPGCMMAALDYSQIEAVLLGHFAQGSQAEWFRERLREGADLHNIVMDMTGITYRPVVKTFNYGCIYGMGLDTALAKNYVLFEKLAKEEGKTPEVFAREIYDNYHKKFPVVRDTMRVVQNIAKMQGYVTTLGGRYQHKPRPQYDPVTGKVNDFLYKMLNKLIQGSAADILKFALLKAYEDGIFDILTMHLTVHDENVVSVPFNKVGTEACVALQETMNMSFHDVLKVPIKACCELGPNWGYWSGDIYEEMKKGNFDPEFFNKDYKETH